MAKSAQLPEPTVARLELQEPTVRRLDPAEVAQALGAEPTGDKVPNAGPLTLYALRAELYRRRISKGGRPGIDGADQRPKIPVSDQDWADLEKLAAELGGPGHSPSAGQVASILLSLAIESVKNETKPQPESRPMGERLAEKVSSRT